MELEGHRGGNGGGVAALWDLPSGKQRSLSLHSKEPLNLLALSHNGKTLATVQKGTETVVTLWDLEKNWPRTSYPQTLDGSSRRGVQPGWEIASRSD